MLLELTGPYRGAESDKLFFFVGDLRPLSCAYLNDPLITWWLEFVFDNNPVKSGVGKIFNIVIQVLISCLSPSLYCRYFPLAFDGS